MVRKTGLGPARFSARRSKHRMATITSLAHIWAGGNNSLEFRSQTTQWLRRHHSSSSYYYSTNWWVSFLLQNSRQLGIVSGNVWNAQWLCITPQIHPPNSRMFGPPSVQTYCNILFSTTNNSQICASYVDTSLNKRISLTVVQVPGASLNRQRY